MRGGGDWLLLAAAAMLVIGVIYFGAVGVSFLFRKIKRFRRRENKIPAES